MEKKEFCTFCSKEYKPKKWTNYGKIFGKNIIVGESHNCKMQKAFYKAKNKIKYYE